MPKDEFDHEDPMALVGVELPATDRDVEEFTRAVIEEYALIGYSREMIVRLFQGPQFSATYSVWQSRGQAWLDGMIDRVSADWRLGSRS
ncbi:MAG: hypothetical protein HZA54_13800 [Planctomycetes bacterium]|nr:hypothetical protein [Planctomycetota bacterium]